MKILSPEGSVGVRGISLAASPDVLAGRRLAVLDNGKPGAALVMTQLAERLAARARVEFVGVHRKGTAATPCEASLIEEIVDAADLVLTGTAD
jgi:hypothetical protein